MSDNSIYSEIILSKTGLEIPLLKNNKSIDSRYDPLRESQRLAQSLNEDTHFVIVIGIASGIFIQTLLESRKNLFVLALEKSQADLDFLKKLPLIQKIQEEKRLAFCSLDDFENKIIELYVPAFYGNLQVIEQRGWVMENPDCIDFIKAAINRACGIVSADFSVQSHFGKLWQHNILCNLKTIDKTYKYKVFPQEKTALVLAAGPSLDKEIQSLLKNPDSYYIIASDTALSILAAYKIIPDAVISIDGQNVSNVHFIHNSKEDFSKTLFLFDLCANSSAVKTVVKNNYRFNFFISGHPFCQFVNTNYKLGLPDIFSGAGTVTISAVDFAIKVGFKNIIVAGADFSYSNGKPYAKGTYLDRLYNQNSNRLGSSQQLFNKLEFRTELIKNEKGFTTKVLEAYRTSFENYLEGNFVKENNLYKISNSLNKPVLSFYDNSKIQGQDILSQLKELYKNKNPAAEYNTIYDLSKSDICLLPLISWLRNHDSIETNDFMYYYKRALIMYNGLGGI